MLSTALSLRVHVAAAEQEAGAAAGRAAVAAIQQALAERGHARVVFASAPSQAAMLEALRDADLDWGNISAFHMDEYVGIDPTDPRAFSTWLAKRLPTDQMRAFETINSRATPDVESDRYEAILRESPIDVTLMGFGVNGHVAFNEPGCDLDVPRFVRPVELTRESREQQVTEGLFESVGDTPAHAVTLTVPALMSASTVIATVVGSHKAGAVHEALTGALSADCPATALRFHPNAQLFLDEAAAGGSVQALRAG